MRRRDRLAAARAALEGLVLTEAEVVDLLNACTVPRVWQPCSPARIDRAISALKTHYPDVRLTFFDGGGTQLGWATSGTRIKVARHLPQSITIETIAHELAHVIAWDWKQSDQDHGPHWGVAYSQAYGLIYEDHT